MEDLFQKLSSFAQKQSIIRRGRQEVISSGNWSSVYLDKPAIGRYWEILWIFLEPTYFSKNIIISLIDPLHLFRLYSSYYDVSMRINIPRQVWTYYLFKRRQWSGCCLPSPSMLITCSKFAKMDNLFCIDPLPNLSLFFSNFLMCTFGILCCSEYCLNKLTSSDLVKTDKSCNL